MAQVEHVAQKRQSEPMADGDARAYIAVQRYVSRGGEVGMEAMMYGIWHGVEAARDRKEGSRDAGGCQGNDEFQNVSREWINNKNPRLNPNHIEQKLVHLKSPKYLECCEWL
jgi:hypothetical protein